MRPTERSPHLFLHTVLDYTNLEITFHCCFSTPMRSTPKTKMESSNDCLVVDGMFQIVARDVQMLKDVLNRIDAGSVECGNKVKIAKRVRGVWRDFGKWNAIGI